MLLILTLSPAFATPDLPNRNARAAVRIVRAGKASKTQWETATDGWRKEIVIDGPAGGKVRLRVIEFE